MEDKNLNNNNEDLQPTDSGETVFYFDNDDSAESATTDENATVTEVDGAVVVEFNGEDDEPAVPEGEIEMVFDAEPEAIETEVFRDIEDMTVEEFTEAEAVIEEIAETEAEPDMEEETVPEAEEEPETVAEPQVVIPHVAEPRVIKPEEPKAEPVTVPVVEAPTVREINEADKATLEEISSFIHGNEDDKATLEEISSFIHGNEPHKKSKEEIKAEKEEKKKEKEKTMSIVSLVLLLLALAIPVGFLAYTLLPLINMLIEFIGKNL